MIVIEKIKRIPKIIFLSCIALIYILPLTVIFTNSFMSEGEIKRNYDKSYIGLELKDGLHYAKYSLVPERVSVQQYKHMFFETPMYLELFMNSVKLTLPIVVFQIIIGTLAAYGFISCNFRFKNFLLYVYIIVMLLPFQATLVPNYIITSKLGLMGSYLSIILPSVFSPFPVFIMYQSMKSIHKDIFFAAELDGATHIDKFRYMALPLSKSGIASLAILSFTDYWSMIEQPMIFIKDISKEPLSLFLSHIGEEQIGLIFAASLFYMLPALWLFIYNQDYFIEGVRLSAIK